jgi:tRNA-modifying protein YgfZ
MTEQQQRHSESTGKTPYEAARQDVALADLSACGWVRLAGPDRVAFLQRMTTNDCRVLAPGSGLSTVLTSPTGRVMAFVMVYAADNALYLRTEPGQGVGVARYLSGLIFWNDHVTVSDLSLETGQWGLYGPGATASLSGLLGDQAASGMAPYAWITAPIDGHSVSLHRGGPLELAAWTVVGPSGSTAASALATAGAWLDYETLTQLRVEAGLPTWGHELTDQVTPLEAGLRAAVNFNKGCYIGQEIIARQENYAKVTRELAGLLLPEALPPAALPDLTGSAVHSGAGRPGYVGTAAWSPALRRPVALAIVPRDAAQPGSTVTIRFAGDEICATVAGLPFASSAPQGNPLGETPECQTPR